MKPWLAHRLFCGLGVFTLCATVLIGCGSSGGGKNGIVKGTVKLDGTPANSGTVTFVVGSDSVSGTIDGEGNYRVTGVPPGSAKVTVTPAVNPAGKAAPPSTPGMPGSAPSGPPTAIPAKYGKAETSGLSHTVTSGESTYNIDLTK